MADDVEQRRKSSFKRRFSLDIMKTAPKLFFRRTSNIEAQMMTLKVSDYGDDSLQRSPVASPLPVLAKKEKVFGVLLLENNSYKVLNGEDERHLNQLLIQAHEDFTVVNYRLIIQNIRYTFRIEPNRKRQESVSPRLDVTFSFPEERRIDILLEWLNSETDSCHFLHNLVDSYVKPLRQLPSLTDEDHQLIFKDVEQLRKATLDLVQKMQCLCSNWNDSDNDVGCLFSDVIDNYSTYVTNYPKYIRRLEAKMKFDQSFSEFCQEQESRGKLPLETLLYLPVKRIAEYDRYLQNLLAETEPSHQDYESLNNAVKRVNAIKHIAELDKSSHTDVIPGETDVLSDGGNDQSEKSRTLPSNKRDSSSSAVIFKHLTVGSKFRPANNWSQSMGLPFNGESDGLAGNSDERMYVMEGPVVFTQGSTKQDRYLFLFSDILLVAKEKSSATFKLKYRVNVTDLLIACIEAADNTMQADKSFVIGWKSTNLIATFNDANTKEMWLNNILERRNKEKAKQQLNKLNATRRSNDTDESEDEAYYEEAPNRKHKRGALLNIFKKSSREETTNANELTRPTGKLFGQPLETVCTTDNEPPKHVLSMLEILFREGAYTTGILRKSANMKVCKEIKKHIDESDSISLEDHQVLAIGSVLKDYLRSIPKSLLLEDLYDDWMEAEKLEEKSDQIKKIKEILATKLPTCHFTLLRYVMCVLHHIDENSTENKMSASNLAVCIAPSLLSSKNKNANMNPQSVNSAIKVVQLMIENCSDIFGENVVHLFGSSSIGHKIRPDSDSDSMHSILSTQESTGGMRRDGSSMDSLVEEVQLFHGESSPKSGKSHISPSSLSHDSGLITSDSQAYEDDLTDSDRKLYLRSMSSQDRSTYSYSDCGSMYSRSMESTSSFETHEPVAPPRRKKDFSSSSTFDTFINYPRPQSAYSRIGGIGKAVRSHPDLGKRLSGDSLKSVEEAAEDMPSEMSNVLRPRTISSRFRSSEPMLSVSTSREQVVRQSAVSDGTPPVSPISPNSYFTSSRDSLTSESSTSNNQFSIEDVTDLCQTNSKYEKDSDSNSFSSTIVINHFGTPEHQTFLSSQSSSPNSFSDSMNKSVPLTITQQHGDLYTSDKPSNFLASPTISITQCSSSSEEKLDEDDDDDFGFKKSPRAPAMKIHQQVSPRSMVNKSYGSPPPRVVLENLEVSQSSFGANCLETGSGIVLHNKTQRRNSLDSLADFRIEQKTNEMKHQEHEGLMASRKRVTVIHRSRLHNRYSDNYMSMTDLSAIKADQARQLAKCEEHRHPLEEHKRPSEPPSYNEAMQRNFKLLCGLPPDITDQDTKKQKEASARAKELYQKSIQTYESDSQHKQTTRSSEIKGQMIEDNDVYVTLSRDLQISRDLQMSRDPREIYEESMLKYESSVQNPKSVEQISNPNNLSTSVSLHRSQSDLTSRPISKLTLRLNEQNRQTQSTSCLDPSIKKSKTSSQPPSYKDAMISKQTIKDYTQPEATQVPIIVEKTEILKDISQNSLRKVSSDSSSAHRQSSASKVKSDLPWNVSAMTKIFEHQSGPSDSPYSKSVLPPPYQHPPPFKRENNGVRTSVSSNSSGGSFITTQTKQTTVRRSGPQYVDYSFSSSSEDLNSSGNFSHYREDSVESCDDFTDVSYV